MMDAQLFLAEFGHIVNATGGVNVLRELILHLATAGRLIQQLSTDEHAQELLERMQKNADRKSSKKRGGKKIGRIQPQAELKSPLPNGWALARLGELGDWGAGATPSRSVPSYYRGNIPWFKSGELKTSYLTESEEFISELALAQCSLRLNAPGDVLIAMYGANIGQTAITGVACTTNQAVCACTPHAGLSNQYLLLMLRALKAYFIGIGTGGAQPNISREKIVATYVALPPAAEQPRIVAKVDELMALCDKLETQQQDRRKLQNALRKSVLDAVSRAQGPRDLRKGWARLDSNLRQIFCGPDDVKELHHLVLDLALTGRMSVKEDHDEPVETFIARCKKAKDNRVASGEMKRKKVSATDVFQMNSDIPEYWHFVPLEELFQFIDYRGKTPQKTDSGVVLVTAKNVRPGKLNREPMEFVSEDSYAEWMTRGFPKVGDLLFTTEAPLGNVAQIEDPPEFALAQRIIDLQPFADIDTKCVMYFIMSPTFQDVLVRNSTGMTAKGIKAAKLKQVMLPVPPIEEQNRIVRSVEKLACYCNELAAKLDRAAELADRLANAAVSSLTGITAEQKEESPMKLPEAKLVATLRLGSEPNVKAQAPLATLLARNDGEMNAKDLWQRFGGDIGSFYAQLKTEVDHGWIEDPSYVLDENAPDSPKSYPDGALVAKVVIKEDV